MKGLSYHPAALALALTLTLLAAETSALNFGRESGIALTKRYDASAQCGDLSGNSDRIWGIDYNRFNARPYVRFVLAQSDGKDQGDRMVIDIPNCGNWAKEEDTEYDLKKTFNKDALWLHKENPASMKFGRKACQTFLMNYFPNLKSGFDKFALTTAVDSKSRIGWHSDLQTQKGVPYFVQKIDPFNLMAQQTFQLLCKDWYKEDRGHKYYATRCLIKRASGGGDCLGATAVKDSTPLQIGSCPDSLDDAKSLYIWNIQAVAEEIA